MTITQELSIDQNSSKRSENTRWKLQTNKFLSCFRFLMEIDPAQSTLMSLSMFWGEKWTREEKLLLRLPFKHLTKIVVAWLKLKTLLELITPKIIQLLKNAERLRMRSSKNFYRLLKCIITILRESRMILRLQEKSSQLTTRTYLLALKMMPTSSKWWTRPGIYQEKLLNIKNLVRVGLMIKMMVSLTNQDNAIHTRILIQMEYQPCRQEWWVVKILSQTLLNTMMVKLAQGLV